MTDPRFAPRPVVYIAGPFSGANGYEVERNVRRAEDYILPIAEAGGAPLCPHTMTRTFDGTLTYQDWIAITLSHLSRADAILLIPQWSYSTGAIGERDFAKAHAIPIFDAEDADLDHGELPEPLTRWLGHFTRATDDK